MSDKPTFKVSYIVDLFLWVTVASVTIWQVIKHGIDDGWKMCLFLIPYAVFLIVRLKILEEMINYGDKQLSFYRQQYNISRKAYDDLKERYDALVEK